MCKGASIVRIIATVFLIISFLALLLGFVAPFWTARVDNSTSLMGAGSHLIKSHLNVTMATTPVTTTTMNVFQLTPSLPGTLGPLPGARLATDDGGKEGDAVVDKGEYYWEGLWAKCYANLTCVCWAQHDFALEKSFPDWHKAVQGLFGIGLVILLIVLLTASCHICCCRCCRESFVIARVLGILTIIGLLLVAVALAVYGGFAYVKNNVTLEGPEVKFFFGFYVSVGGAAVAIIAAILYLCDGRRGSNETLEHDESETAKMV